MTRELSADCFDDLGQDIDRADALIDVAPVELGLVDAGLLNADARAGAGGAWQCRASSRLWLLVSIVRVPLGGGHASSRIADEIAIPVIFSVPAVAGRLRSSGNSEMPESDALR